MNPEIWKEAIPEKIISRGAKFDHSRPLRQGTGSTIPCREGDIILTRNTVNVCVLTEYPRVHIMKAGFRAMSDPRALDVLPIPEEFWYSWHAYPLLPTSTNESDNYEPPDNDNISMLVPWAWHKTIGHDWGLTGEGLIHLFIGSTPNRYARCIPGVLRNMYNTCEDIARGEPQRNTKENADVKSNHRGWKPWGRPRGKDPGE